MRYEEQYESWKQRRAKVHVPDGFADRFMASVHQSRRLKIYLLLQGLAATVRRSRIAQASICTAALGIWFVRIGALWTIFIPR